MSTICRDCEAIVVADDDVPADLVRIAMANHERFCKPGRREICDICDDVDFITSSGETNIHAVLSRLTGFRYKALYFNAVGEADVIDSYGNVETIQTVVGGIYPLQNCGVQSGGSTTLNEGDFIALYD